MAIKAQVLSDDYANCAKPNADEHTLVNCYNLIDVEDLIDFFGEPSGDIQYQIPSEWKGYEYEPDYWKYLKIPEGKDVLVRQVVWEKNVEFENGVFLKQAIFVWATMQNEKWITFASLHTDGLVKF